MNFSYISVSKALVAEWTFSVPSCNHLLVDTIPTKAVHTCGEGDGLVPQTTEGTFDFLFDVLDLHIHEAGRTNTRGGGETDPF